MRIKNLKQGCFSCPSDWDAETEDGAPVYIRYRWGHLSVRVDGRTVLGIDHGDGLDGTMDTETMLRLTKLEVIE